MGTRPRFSDTPFRWEGRAKERGGRGEFVSFLSHSKLVTRETKLDHEKEMTMVSPIGGREEGWEGRARRKRGRERR